MLPKHSLACLYGLLYVAFRLDADCNFGVKRYLLVQELHLAFRLDADCNYAWDPVRSALEAWHLIFRLDVD